MSIPPFTPTLQRGVPGPKGHAGYLLRAPRGEALTWDLENEIASTGLHWLGEHGGWWIAAAYYETALDVLLRSFPAVLVLDPVAGDQLVTRETDPPAASA